MSAFSSKKVAKFNSKSTNRLGPWPLSVGVRASNLFVTIKTRNNEFKVLQAVF